MSRIFSDMRSDTPRGLRLVFWLGLAIFVLAILGGLRVSFEREQGLPGISSDPSAFATRLVMAGELDAAVREFQAFEAVVPDANRSILEQARLLASLGRQKEAFQAYGRAARSIPTSAKAQALYGTELFKRGRFAQASQAFERLVRLNPGYPNARENLAVSYLNDGRIEEAIEQYERALEAEGESAAIHDMLSRAFEMNGDRQRALDHAKLAFKLAPENAQIQARFDDLVARDWARR